MTFDAILNTFPAASEYLSTIYLIRRDFNNVSNSRLAEWLDVSRPAVTQAVSRLKKLELITQERYGDIQLTEYGSEFAKKMLRRHYLLEHFLMKNLGFQWHEIDEEAKRLQNSISDLFETRMFEALGQPNTCPHGNPIPGTPNEAEILSAPPLSTVEEGNAVTIMRITEQGEEKPGLLQFIYDNHIELDDKLEIISNKNGEVTAKVIDPSGQLRHAALKIPADFSEHLCFVA